MKKATKKDLKSIEVTVNDDGGFTVWVVENKKEKGKNKTIRHWILDGSVIKDEGKIFIGKNDLYAINAEYNEQDRTIDIVRRRGSKL